MDNEKLPTCWGAVPRKTGCGRVAWPHPAWEADCHQWRGGRGRRCRRLTVFGCGSEEENRVACLAWEADCHQWRGGKGPRCRRLTVFGCGSEEAERF